MDLKSLFIHDIPLIDVRAPIEFESGHFPSSVNLPIMDNEDRHLVGTCYKKFGQEAAIILGHERVSGTIKENRVNDWLNFIQQHPNAKLYCFRGGLRSKTSLLWLKENGIEIEMVPGGYKKMRQFLLETIEKELNQRQFMVLAGRTGSGKTEFLKKVSTHPFLDLEKHAHHKGSSFGYLGTQPSQISFENNIAVDFLKQDQHKITLVESESIMVGAVHVPQNLFLKMNQSPMIVLEKPMEDRVFRIIEEYVFEKTINFGGDFEKTHQFLLNALERVQKKLGGLNYQLIKKQISEAFQSSQVESVNVHMEWVQNLLIHYYDPFYNRSLKKNEARIVFKGNEEACLEFLKKR